MADDNEGNKVTQAANTLVEKGKSVYKYFKGTSGSEIIENVYSKKIFPYQAKAMATISDAVPVSLHDVVLGLNIGLAFVSNTGKAGKVKQAINLALQPGMLSARAYMLNSFRVPLEKKLDVESDLETTLKDEDMRNDIDILCGRINAIYESNPEMGAQDQKQDIFDTAESLASQVIRDVDGVDIASSKRVKTSLMLEGFKKLGVGGLYSPVTGEVFMPSGKLSYFVPFAVTHEKTHAKGHPREYEANTLAYIACKRSEDPFFHYSADMARLGYSLSVLFSPEKFGKGVAGEKKAQEMARGFVEQLPLHDEILDDLLKKYKEMPTILGYVRYGFKQYSNFTLKMRGEKDGIKSYSEKFLKVIRAYERRLEA